MFAHNDLLSGNILLMLNRSDTEASEASGTVQSELSSIPQIVSSESNTPPASAHTASSVTTTIPQGTNTINNTYQSLKKSSRKSIIPPPSSTTTATVPLPTNPTTNTLTHTNTHNINKQVILIDFEYASYNLRSWDIANHFCECAGFDANFEQDFPCIMQRNRFYKAYIIATSTCISSYIAPSSSSSAASAVSVSRLQCMFSSSSGDDDTDTDNDDAAAMWAGRVYTVVNEIAGYIHFSSAKEGGERGSGEEIKGVDIDGDSEAKLAAFLEGFDVSVHGVLVFSAPHTCEPIHISYVIVLYILYISI